MYRDVRYMGERMDAQEPIGAISARPSIAPKRRSYKKALLGVAQCLQRHGDFFQRLRIINSRRYGMRLAVS
jgi:hypothetical protein